MEFNTYNVISEECSTKRTIVGPLCLFELIRGEIIRTRTLSQEVMNLKVGESVSTAPGGICSLKIERVS